jgi:hypothetical protein
VRIEFNNFKNKNECNNDKRRLLEENETIAEIVKSCRDIVYVDKPHINDDDLDTINNNKEIRQKSREILLDYLDKTCQDEYFKLKSWDVLREQIAENLQNNSENLPELENNQEFNAILTITERFCSIM